MDLRQYLEIVRRHRWSIVGSAIFVAAVAVAVSLSQTPLYVASAEVALKPGDSQESVYGDSGSIGSLLSDPDRYVSGQIEIASSKRVAERAAKALGEEVDVLRDGVIVEQDAANDIIVFTATHPSADLARDYANAMAEAYKEDRRRASVEAIEKAAEELQATLDGLLAQIAELDARIDGSGGTGGTSTPAQPSGGSSVGPSTPGISGTSRGVSPGGAATTEEGLKTARFAAATQYEQLFARQNELRVNASLQQGQAEIIESAETPLSPDTPKPARNGVLGTIVGLLLGLGLAFLREQLDDKVRTREEVEELAGLPVLAELPLDEQAERDPTTLVALHRPNAPLAEAARSLRTSLQFMGIDEPIRHVVVTSAEPGDGKSLVAANLAAVYAQAGLRTVLVSGDLRRPRVEAMFGIDPRQTGLTDVVAGRYDAAERRAARAASVDDDGAVPAKVPAATIARRRRAALQAALVPTAVEGLVVLPAGSQAPNPAELLSSHRTDELLDDLVRIADVVVIDSPPVLAVTDAAVLGQKTDGIILVASVGRTHKQAVSRAVSSIDTSQILGVVVNRSGGVGYGYRGYTGYYAADEGRGRPAVGSTTGAYVAPGTSAAAGKLTRKQKRALKREAKADARSWKRAQRLEAQAAKRSKRGTAAGQQAEGQREPLDVA